MLGGRTVGGEPITDMLEYLPETDTWTHAAPKARAGHAAAVIDNVTVFGGEHIKGLTVRFLVMI